MHSLSLSLSLSRMRIFHHSWGRDDTWAADLMRQVTISVTQNQVACAHQGRQSHIKVDQLEEVAA